MPKSPQRLGSGLRIVAFLALALGPGCTTVSSLNSAARSLDTFALNPLPPEAAGPSSGPLLFIAEPTASGAIASDRIVIRPNALQVALLADGRWVEAAPAHVRSLLARSFANTGRFDLVTTGAVGPLPDFTLLVEIEAFEAQVLPAGGAPARAVVSMTLTMVRDADGRLVASRRFTRAADATDTDALSIVSAFEAANGQVLREAVPWATAVATGRTGA